MRECTLRSKLYPPQWHLYTVSGKKGATLFFAITLPNFNRSSKFFYLTLSSKFAIRKSLNILPSFTRVATLPCKTVVLKNRKLHKNGLYYKRLHNKIICCVNSHILASNYSTNKSAYGQCVTKNNVQNVHHQPTHKLTNDDATDESLLWRLRDPGWTIQHSIAK